MDHHLALWLGHDGAIIASSFSVTPYRSHRLNRSTHVFLCSEVGGGAVAGMRRGRITKSTFPEHGRSSCYCPCLALIAPFASRRHPPPLGRFRLTWKLDHTYSSSSPDNVEPSRASPGVRGGGARGRASSGSPSTGVIVETMDGGRTWGAPTVVTHGTNRPVFPAVEERVLCRGQASSSSGNAAAIVRTQNANRADPDWQFLTMNGRCARIQGVTCLSIVTCWAVGSTEAGVR